MSGQDIARTEFDTEGNMIPVWMPGDDEYAERLQISVVWVPMLYLNGHHIDPFGLGPEPLPEAAVTARLFKRAVTANRARSYEAEMAEVAEALEAQMPMLGELTRAYLAALVRLSLARRGYPVP